MLFSCFKPEEEITWKVGEHTDMLVVESIITNEFKHQSIKLSLSNTYFDTTHPRNLSGAIVSIEDGTEIFNFLEAGDTPGLYTSENPFAAEELKTYKLNITLSQPVNGLSEYNAVCQMPEGFKMDSIKSEIYALPELDFDTTEDDDTAVLVIYYFGVEPVKSENFYFTKTYINDKLIDDTPKEYNFYSTSYENTGYVFIDSYFKNTFQNDTVTFQLFTINRNYYKYLEGVSIIDDSGNAMSMSGPPANAVGNVNNALGYFLTAFVSEDISLAIDMRE